MNIEKSWKARAALALMSATSLCAGDSKPAKISSAPKPEIQIKQKIAPQELAKPEVEIKLISESEGQKIIKDAKLPQSDKDWLLKQQEEIEAENLLEEAKAIASKREREDIFSYTGIIVKQLERVHSQMITLRDKGIITDEQIRPLKAALGFSKLTPEKKSLFIFNKKVPAKEFGFSTAESSKLDAWAKRSNDPKEKEKLQEEIKAKIKEGHTPVKKFKIDPNGIKFRDRLILA